jgi:hypothetical protein
MSDGVSTRESSSPAPGALPDSLESTVQSELNH